MVVRVAARLMPGATEGGHCPSSGGKNAGRADRFNLRIRSSAGSTTYSDGCGTQTAVRDDDAGGLEYCTESCPASGSLCEIHAARRLRAGGLERKEKIVRTATLLLLSLVLVAASYGQSGPAKW